MPEGLSTADGKAVDAPPIGNEEGFADLMVGQARAADGDQAEMPAPPKRDPDAPYGRTRDGRPKKGPGGRPAKDKPRVERPKAAIAKRDYTEELTGVVQLAWGVLAPMAPADAAAVKMSGPGMVQAWNALAQENAQVARGIEWLTSGSAYGAVVMATAPLVLQVLANHNRIPAERVAALGVLDPRQLAEVTAQDLTAMQAAQQAAA
jgi:hypothetical protein